MADDPLKVQRGDDAYTARQKREAELERDSILDDLRVLGFTVKWTKMKRYFELTCRHKRYVALFDTTLSRRRHWHDDFLTIRAEHRKKCGKE